MNPNPNSKYKLTFHRYYLGDCDVCKQVSGCTGFRIKIIKKEPDNIDEVPLKFASYICDKCIGILNLSLEDKYRIDETRIRKDKDLHGSTLVYTCGDQFLKIMKNFTGQSYGD